MEITLVVPSRNNLKYLQWSYASVRKNQGSHTVYFCTADDASTDGTWEWMQAMAEHDPYFRCIRNDGPERLGHTILYDRIVNELVTTDLAMIWHADMYLCPGALDAIEKIMYSPPIKDGYYDITESWKRNRKTIISLTRIEPPLHPPGPEKVIRDFGTEPENFDENAFLAWVHRFQSEVKIHGHRVNKALSSNFTTDGVFAPWAFWVKEFKEIGGHDLLFAPQSKEDSDIWNRFLLNGIKFLQTWEGFVYHMTCRGSRFNPTLTTPGKNSREWEEQNIRSTRNFIRKWGHFVKHDPHLHPIVPHKYDIAFVVSGGGNVQILYLLEPWCSVLYTDSHTNIVEQYINTEQSNTKYNLHDRVVCGDLPDNVHDVVVYIDLNTLTDSDIVYIQMLAELLDDSGAKNSNMEIGNLKISIRDLIPLEYGLIHIPNK